MQHNGYLFEMGPDGYGYVIDETEPGQSYPIHVKRIEGTFPTQLTELEGRQVSFRIENQRVAQATLVTDTEASGAMAAGTSS